MSSTIKVKGTQQRIISAIQNRMHCGISLKTSVWRNIMNMAQLKLVGVGLILDHITMDIDSLIKSNRHRRAWLMIQYTTQCDILGLGNL